MPEIVSSLILQFDKLCDFLGVIRCCITRGLSHESDKNPDNPTYNQSDDSLLEQPSGIGPYRDFGPFDNCDNWRVSNLINLGLLNRLCQSGVQLLFHCNFTSQPVLLKHKLRRVSVVSIPLQKSLKLIFSPAEFASDVLKSLFCESPFSCCPTLTGTEVESVHLFQDSRRDLRRQRCESRFD
jgi:hypothetical protein